MESGSGETNYWPGFVDALSNVVLTLIFVLVIFVFALVMASNKVEEKMQQVIQAQKDQKAQGAQMSYEQHQDDDEIKQLKKQLEQAQIELKAREIQNEGKSQKKIQDDTGTQDQNSSSVIESDKEIVVQKNEEQEYQASASSIEKNDNKITVIFPDSVSDIDDKALNDLMGKIDKSKIVGKKIIIRSVLGDESYSVAQRLAYYRVLNIRNFLISKVGADPVTISSVIVKPDVVGAGRVEILFSK